MPAATLPPHLMTSGGAKRCSVCKQPLDSRSQPSLGAAFRKHVEEVHWATEKSAVVNQSSDRIVAGKAFSRTSEGQKMALAPRLWRAKLPRQFHWCTVNRSIHYDTSCPNSASPRKEPQPMADRERLLRSDSIWVGHGCTFDLTKFKSCVSGFRQLRNGGFGIQLAYPAVRRPVQGQKGVQESQVSNTQPTVVAAAPFLGQAQTPRPGSGAYTKRSDARVAHAPIFWGL